MPLDRRLFLYSVGQCNAEQGIPGEISSGINLSSTSPAPNLAVDRGGERFSRSYDHRLFRGPFGLLPNFVPILQLPHHDLRIAPNATKEVSPPSGLVKRKILVAAAGMRTQKRRTKDTLTKWPSNTIRVCLHID